MLARSWLDSVRKSLQRFMNGNRNGSDTSQMRVTPVTLSMNAFRNLEKKSVCQEKVQGYSVPVCFSGIPGVA